MASKPGPLYVASGSEDGSVFLWSVDITRDPDKGPTPEVACQANYIDDEVVGEPPRGHIAGVNSICIPRDPGKDIVATGAKDQIAKIWRASGSLEYCCPQHSDSTEGHTDFINHIAWNPQFNMFATASDDATAKIWNGDTGKCVETAGNSRNANQGHTAPIPMLDWASDGTRLLTCSYDTTCALWELRGKTVRLLSKVPKLDGVRSEQHSQAIWSARFSSDNAKFLTASKDGTACVWTTTEMHSLTFLRGHTDSVLQGVWSPHDPRLVLTCSMDNTARVWDIRAQASVFEIKEHSGVVWQATFGRDSVLTASHDMTAAVFDARGGKTRQILTGHTGILWQATYSANEQWALTCSEDTTARLWHVGSGKTKPKYIVLQSETEFHKDACNCAVFMDAPVRPPAAKAAAPQGANRANVEGEEQTDTEEPEDDVEEV